MMATNLATARWVENIRKRWREYKSFRALKKLEMIAYFHDYPASALRADYEDLLGLYLITMQRKPAVLLELGGGCSTFVFAHAVRELSRQGCYVTFYSVDESDYWQGLVKDRIPVELRPFIRFARCDPRLVEMNVETVSIYDPLPVKTSVAL
jgi:hypothetical protein